MISPRRSCSFSSSDLKRAMALISSRYSSSILDRSRPVNRARRMSRMAWAWISVRPSSRISASRASPTVAEARISSTTRSMLSRAILRPSRMWARASAFFSSKMVRRVTTSRRWLMKRLRTCFRESSSGLPATIQTMLTPKEVSMAE